MVLANPRVDDLLGSFRWYNALCINQNDGVEKRVQVQYINLIYSNAIQVIALLGAERWTISLAPHAFNYISTTPWPSAPMTAHQRSWFDASHEHDIRLVRLFLAEPRY